MPNVFVPLTVFVALYLGACCYLGLRLVALALRDVATAVQGIEIRHEVIVDDRASDGDEWKRGGR